MTAIASRSAADLNRGYQSRGGPSIAALRASYALAFSEHQQKRASARPSAGQTASRSDSMSDDLRPEEKTDIPWSILDVRRWSTFDAH